MKADKFYVSHEAFANSAGSVKRLSYVQIDGQWLRIIGEGDDRKLYIGPSRSQTLVKGLQRKMILAAADECEQTITKQLEA